MADDSKRIATGLFAAAGLAALGFAIVTRRVARGRTARIDAAVKRRIHALRGNGARRAARLSTPLGKWYAHLPAAVVVGRRWQRRGHGKAAVATLATSLSAAALSRGLDRAVQHRSPPPERREPSKQSYPSGHALETSALAFVSTYLTLREHLAPRWTVAPIVLASAIAGAGRLMLDRHWASDVAGGYCAGIALGATCAGVYELARG